tara:strand:- start:2231 stop:3148 length:918 start_codon:yes stop_codon:yes gene_type:complete
MNNINSRIVIVTYNGMPWLKKCLDSCKDHSVIIIDNASSDETVSFIKTNYPKVVLLEQKVNLGFGQANNLGIRYALDQGADHVFLLNQDAYFVDDALEKLISFQKQNPEYGILSPIHITGDKKKLDFNFSFYMQKEKTGQFFSDFVLGNDLAPVYEVPFVNAAAWLLSKKCLTTVGGFDPLFFHYGEDDNYCQRTIYHNFKIGVLSQVYVIHDREDRVSNKPIKFSHKYFMDMLITYKVCFANLNTENELDLKVRLLQKSIIKLQMKMKINRAFNYKKELSLLLKAKPLIEKSRKINKTKGSHYL